MTHSYVRYDSFICVIWLTHTCDMTHCLACVGLRCHSATRCNTLQHTATHCTTLQHTTTRCNTLQHTATHYNTLQHTATHCNTLQHAATHIVQQAPYIKKWKWCMHILRHTCEEVMSHCNTL